MEGRADLLPNTKMEFAVEMRSPCCVDRVKDALGGLKGVKSIDVNLATQRLVIEGDVLADTIRDTVEKRTGMAAVLLGHGSSLHNFGAGVAAISIGNSDVRGLLRFVQVDPTTCFVEGSLDKLPTPEPVFLTVHETGDVSDGCNSCGSLFKYGDDDDTRNPFGGILKQLTPDKDQRAEFRTAMSNFKLADIIGHCVVVHQGSHNDIEHGKSKRLACGIVARSSGLFQNSKRFCACDGVTIWEQRQRDIENGKL
uniref:Superoxide dismutase copper chaperone n=2 Tax=Arion vulgaris TaxID=1028688 RepID=A0A0B7AA38_9EUPU